MRRSIHRRGSSLATTCALACVAALAYGCNDVGDATGDVGAGCGVDGRECRGNLQCLTQDCPAGQLDPGGHCRVLPPSICAYCLHDSDCAGGYCGTDLHCYVHTGPGPNPDAGSLDIVWSVGSQGLDAGCAGAEVGDVLVSVDEQNPFAQGCAVGHLEVDGLDPGTHAVTAKPLRTDTQCFANLSGTCQVESTTATVTPGTRTTVHLDRHVFGEIDVTWTLDGLPPDDRACSALKTQKVQVDVFDQFTLVRSEEFPCTWGQAKLLDLPSFHTYTVKAHAVRDDGSSAGLVDSGQLRLLEPGSLLDVALPFVFDVNSIGTLEVTWTVNGVAPPATPDPCAAVGAEHVSISYPSGLGEPRCDLGRTTFTAVVPGTYDLIGILEDGNQTLLDSSSQPFTVVGAQTSAVHFDFTAVPGGTVLQVEVRASPDTFPVTSWTTVTATVLGRGNYLSGVAWSSTPAGGSITPAIGGGVTFTAPVPGDYTITATSVQDGSISGSTVVHVTPPACRPTPQIVFEDHTFVPGDWTDALAAGTTAGISASAHAEQRLTGGVPGEYRWVTNHLAGVGILLHQNLLTAAVFDPRTQGAISGIDASFDISGIDGFAANAYFLALLQDGQLYRTTRGAAGPAGSWGRVSYQGLTAADFVLVNGSAPGPLDLETGTPIQIGYLVAISSTVTTPIDHQSGLDNFKVTLSCK